MKKLMLTTVLFVSMYAMAFAGNDKLLLKDLNKAFKNSSQVSWIVKDDYKRGSFSFNNKKVTAYYNESNDELVGYVISLEASDLPAASIAAINKRYAGWQITETILFINTNGFSSHFVHVKNGKKDFALKVNGDRVNFYQRMY